MKVPRNLSSTDLIKSLDKLGYQITRQTGSHMRLTTDQQGTHHITIPAHDPLKIGTLNSIFREVAEHFKMSKEELIMKLF